jgi:hypothetical protein
MAFALPRRLVARRNGPLLHAGGRYTGQGGAAWWCVSKSLGHGCDHSYSEGLAGQASGACTSDCLPMRAPRCLRASARARWARGLAGHAGLRGERRRVTLSALACVLQAFEPVDCSARLIRRVNKQAYAQQATRWLAGRAPESEKYVANRCRRVRRLSEAATPPQKRYACEEVHWPTVRSPTGQGST